MSLGDCIGLLVVAFAASYVGAVLLFSKKPAAPSASSRVAAKHPYRAGRLLDELEDGIVEFEHAPASTEAAACETCVARARLLEPLSPQRKCPRCQQGGHTLPVTARCLTKCELGSGVRVPHVHALCGVCKADWTEIVPERYPGKELA